MANYGNQQGGGQPSSGGARDAAFANIFGASPAMAGRSQTMTSQSHMRVPDRAATMSSQTADMMQRMPPMRQPVNGYDRRPPAPYDQRAQSSYDPQRPQSHDQPPQNYQRPMQPPNGYPPDPRFAQGVPQQRQPQPQYLPQPLRPERQPYGQPQRFDSRPSPPGQLPFNKPMPPRFPTGGPALNNDPYRSQSLATGTRPQFNAPGQSYQSPANTFRQQPYMNHMARTTAQGRVVPERPDERTMSMTSYRGESEFEPQQTMMSGRVIPGRRRESGGQEMAPDQRSSPAVSPPPNMGPGTKTRNASQGSIPQMRTMSMASTIAPSIAPSPSERTETMSSSVTRPSSTATTNSNNRASGQSHAGPVVPAEQQQRQRRAPLVYPALLSRVATTFKDRVQISEKEKDGLVYQSAFTGADAVDLIAFIIKTTDRNLALLLGRSLDAQKFFHDVTYAHRLRDSTNEIYQFRETMMEEQAEVNGVFTLLTECYSPTCTRDRLCYSIACPRRLEQQARLNLRIQPGLKREESRASLHEDAGDEEQKLWINTVPKEIADGVSDKEKKRQEIISELMYTERDFVKDLEYLRDFWMKPLRNPQTSPIPEHRREKFVRTVFSNCQEVYMVNSRLAESLTRRQQNAPVVKNVGDIFLEYVPHFIPFIKYGANQLFGKYEFEHEKRTNAAFSKFVDEVERMKESRKLELNGYLTKPTTRLARYPLLLEGILKATADDNPDKQDLPKVVKMIKDTLSKVNVESGKAENHFNLMQLNKDLKFRPGEYVDLKLTDENRQLVFKGNLKKTPTETTGDITCYLFDHAVLLVRSKTVNKREEQKVYKKPIPLELLVITQMDEIIPRLGIAKRPSGTTLMGAGAKAIQAAAPRADANKQQGYPITFKHLGKGGYEMTLYASTPISQQKWMEHIESQQRTLRERSNIFTKSVINEGFFSAAIRVTCAVPLGKSRVVCLLTHLTCPQMVVASWLWVQTLVSTSWIESRRMPRCDPSECWTPKVLRRLTSSNSIKFCSYSLIKPCTHTPQKHSTRMRRKLQRSVPGRSAMPTFSSLASVQASNLWHLLRHRRCQRPSRSSSPRRTWRTRLRSLVLLRCSRKGKTSSSRTRSSTFLLNHHRFTSCARSFALVVPVDSRLSVSKLWRPNRCSIKPIHRSTLLYARKTSGPSTLNVWVVSSCSVTRITPSSSTVMVGEPDQTGRSPGRAIHNLSRSSTLTSLPSSPVLSKYGIWRVVAWCTSSPRRTSGGCTHPHERYCMPMRTSWATTSWPAWISGKRQMDLPTSSCFKAAATIRARRRHGSKNSRCRSREKRRVTPGSDLTTPVPHCADRTPVGHCYSKRDFVSRGAMARISVDF